MFHLYKITHRVNGSDRTVAVEARNADEAQERFVAHFEEIGAVHGAILCIRQVGAV